MDSIVILLAVLIGGAVLAGIVAFFALSAIASLVEILPPRVTRAEDEEDFDDAAPVRGLREPARLAAASLRGSRPAV
jgi:hypothetical protein